MTTSPEELEKMHLEGQDKNFLYIVDLLLLEAAELGVATNTLAWRVRSEGKFPKAGEEITAFGKQFSVVGSFGNKIFVKSRIDRIGVNKGQRA